MCVKATKISKGDNDGKGSSRGASEREHQRTYSISIEKVANQEKKNTFDNDT